MLVISRSCGKAPLLYFMSKRDRPSAWIVAAIFRATVSGAPTQIAPSGPASRSNCARVTGGQPRSAPIFVIIAA